MVVRQPFEIGSDDARESLDRQCDPDTEDHDRAQRRERSYKPPLEGDAAEGTARQDGDEADARDRRGETEAERGDQGKAEPDAVDGDRRQEHDESRGARRRPAAMPTPRMPFEVRESSLDAAWSW